ncbi:MAG TPA: L-seryl-tRNA(Sec) selenium transferase, partial [Pyrinomonadaceae bacterium]|nr:L-seryl-tRNA(Sec) selenium transferase [Pyrinomonadaceae bacterium]
RQQLESGTLTGNSKLELLAEGIRLMQHAVNIESASSIQRVLNATGVILHTNLGRAPLSAAARTAITNASGYCTLEYDALTGERGKRGGYAEELLCQLTGAEAALIVNNCAAAALLILRVFAGNGETIVSRGELVEIGGDFRVPEVMANSGTTMVEVGTTNRTTLDDYARAIGERTRLIMRVHPSNYRIVGFTTSPDITGLATLAHESGLVMYEDAGSGVLVDLSTYGIAGEPVIRNSIAAGVDLVSFSGDKLLGGPQAGLIVGRCELVDRLRKNSLYRALRADKLCLAAIEATLDAHRRNAFEELPALRMLALEQETLESRARDFAQQIGAINPALACDIVAGTSAVGGGSGPTIHPKTGLIALRHDNLHADQVAEKLRLGSPAVIARIADGRVVIDLRTVDPEEEPELLEALKAL